MIAQELIQVIKSASVDEIAELRALLRVPEADFFHYSMKDPPRNLGELLDREKNRSKSSLDPEVIRE